MDNAAVAYVLGASPRKRPRVDSDLDAEEAKVAVTRTVPMQDEMIWFKDGNVTLEAGDIAFRVYGGLLARHSEPLGKLIDEAPKSWQWLTGLPVGLWSHSRCTVRLEDAPDEVRCLLRILILADPFCGISTRMPFSDVAALVRLGHKYEIQHVLEEGLRRMKSCFSDSFEVWDKASKSGGNTLMSFSEEDAIAAVNIARLTGATSMLPTAMYSCCQRTPEVITNGVPGPNGKIERLSPEDVLICLGARTILCHHNVIAAMNIWIPEPECDVHGAECMCVRVINATSAGLRTYEDSGLAHHDALQDWTDTIEHVAA
ncbi:uncharacterized protein B0H18DRAFT_904061, partial [Fomitopsis serialis]|uniref:uncharacterized protein n=1 Tax=Fomitopsis serialis TaxID=139415 RepID=UPI002008C4BF